MSSGLGARRPTAHTPSATSTARPELGGGTVRPGGLRQVARSRPGKSSKRSRSRAGPGLRASVGRGKLAPTWSGLGVPCALSRIATAPVHVSWAVLGCPRGCASPRWLTSRPRRTGRRLPDLGQTLLVARAWPARGHRRGGGRSRRCPTCGPHPRRLPVARCRVSACWDATSACW